MPFIIQSTIIRKTFIIVLENENVFQMLYVQCFHMKFLLTHLKLNIKNLKIIYPFYLIISQNYFCIQKLNIYRNKI